MSNNSRARVTIRINSERYNSESSMSRFSESSVVWKYRRVEFVL